MCVCVCMCVVLCVCVSTDSLVLGVEVVVLITSLSISPMMSSPSSENSPPNTAPFSSPVYINNIDSVSISNIHMSLCLNQRVLSWYATSLPHLTECGALQLILSHTNTHTHTFHIGMYVHTDTHTLERLVTLN